MLTEPTTGRENKMTAQERRADMRGVVRGELRYRGYEPTETDKDTIYRIMDDMAVKYPAGSYAAWYLSASDRQIKLMVAETIGGVR